MELIKFNYMLEIDILRNSSQNILGALRGAFLVFGCPKRHPDALLAKTMLISTLKDLISLIGLLEQTLMLSPKQDYQRL